MRPADRGAWEALAFTAATLAYIWALRFYAGWTLWLLVAWATASILRRSETLDEAGLSPRRAAVALAAWKYAWLLALPALAAVLGARLLEPPLLLRAGVYFLWCCIQQTVYQNLVYRRMRAGWGPGPRSWTLAGLAFGLVHLPNPVLVPATAVWGAVSSRLFERWRSLPALALAQTILSSLLYETTPRDWHHGFRVGPGYFF